MNWKTDWKTFIESVAKDFDAGHSDEEVTSIYAGHDVLWTGTINDKELDDKDMPGMVMDMPAVKVELKDGRSSKVDYLYLHLEKSQVDSWRKLKVGSRVTFRTQIISATGPFAGISWSPLDQKRGVILLSTRGGEPVKTAQQSAQRSSQD